MKQGQTPFSDEPGPQDEVEASETNEWLAEEIGGLPEREQIVLSLYYNDEMNPQGNWRDHWRERVPSESDTH
jgi:DNA-directed RNA polymerase specialized sigma subunit